MAALLVLITMEYNGASGSHHCVTRAIPTTAPLSVSYFNTGSIKTSYLWLAWGNMIFPVVATPTKPSTSTSCDRRNFHCRVPSSCPTAWPTEHIGSDGTNTVAGQNVSKGE